MIPARRVARAKSVLLRSVAVNLKRLFDSWTTQSPVPCSNKSRIAKKCSIDGAAVLQQAAAIQSF
jgi:hypothetical protein